MSGEWKLETGAPILPVKDVRASLARYEKLGFTPRIYGKPSSDEPLIYGFLHRDAVHLHLALTTDLDPHATPRPESTTHRVVVGLGRARCSVAHRHGACPARSDDDVATRSHLVGVGGLVEERPWQAGVVHGVEVDHEVDRTGGHSATSSDSSGPR